MVHRATLSLHVAAAAQLNGSIELRDQALNNFAIRCRQGTLFEPDGLTPNELQPGGLTQLDRSVDMIVGWPRPIRSMILPTPMTAMAGKRLERRRWSKFSGCGDHSRRPVFGHDRQSSTACRCGAEREADRMGQR